MCRLDLWDAYLQISIYREDRKYLKFEYKNKLYQSNALPFRLTSAPFVFTKIGRSIDNWFGKQGIRVVIYKINE